MKRSCVLLCLSACSTGMSKGGAGGSLVDAEPDDEDAATPTPPARDAAVAREAAVAAPDVAVSTDLAALAPDSAAVTVADGPAPTGAPLLAILDQFSAPDVPARGPKEAAPIPHTWALPAAVPMWPGKGLGQHPMLYAGEGYNVLFVINHGKIVWTYTLGPGVGGEVDDVWMLSNGHVLAAFSGSIQEITPKKEVVWRYDVPAPGQVHTCQPVGLDKVLFVQNDTVPHVKIINKTTGKTELDQALPMPGNLPYGGVHTQFRRFRLTAAGTYLASWLALGHVTEYDKNFKIIWDYQVKTPWSSLRLHNGNTLVTSESLRTIREVSPKSETVWEWTQASLPPNTNQQNTQTAERLANGNTVIFSSRSPKDPEHGMIQAIEVDPSRKPVWVLEDWQDLGSATTAQFLDQPGIPENPGDLEH
jgi:hypothetical protein